MLIRDFKKEDKEQVEKIFSKYWTDPEFLKTLSDKLKIYIDQTREYFDEKYRFFVAEEDGEIVGVAGMRKASDYLRVFAKTNNPVEFYVLASKHKRKGTGTALRLKRIEVAKQLGFTEAVFYSPNSHSESWNFHDQMNFERVGKALAPDGEPGQIWRRIL